MVDSFITNLRRWVTELLQTEQRLPVYGYQPGDVSHAPVIVVGRPTAFPGPQPAVMTLNLDINVLGRRLGDADADAELDAHADSVFNVLGGTRGVKIGDENRLLAVERWRPGSVLVAGLDWPAYLFTVSYDILTC